MSTAVATTKPALPAAIAKLLALATPETTNELAGGVTTGFPIISYKGKVWRIRKSGEEIMALDAQGNALPTIDIVLVQANPHPSKIFYEKKYEEGTNESPRCYSNDGLKPDPGIQAPVAKVCAACPNNVWGSRITDNGKKSRACADARRMAVVFLNELNEDGVDCPKYLLRVPPASLNPLKDFAEKILKPKGIPFFAVVTRIGFDPTVAHPQMTFKAARFLSEEEAEAIVQLRGSEDIRRILAEAQDFPVEGTAEAAEPSEAAASTPATPATATTPAAGKSSTKKAAMRPATDEEAGADAIPPAAAKPKAEAIPEAAPVKKAAKKTAAAPPPVDEEEEDIPAANGATKAPADFDSLLDSILNG